MSRTPGVGQALLFRKSNYSMRIWFDSKRLDNLQLTPADVITAIQAQNVQAPIGRIGARPIGADQQFQLNLQTQGRLATLEQFGDIVLRANPDGSLLRLRDVARLELGAQNLDTESRINGQPAVAIGIYLSPGANAVETASSVVGALEQLSQRFPPGLKYLVNYDTTTFVRATFREVLITLLIAFALVVFVVLVFLGSLRATLISAIAVFLRHQGPKRGPMGWVLRRIANVRDGYVVVTRSLVRFSALALVLILASAAAILILFMRTPSGFLPEEDQGAFLISVQLPDGASVARTSEAALRIGPCLNRCHRFKMSLR